MTKFNGRQPYELVTYHSELKLRIRYQDSFDRTKSLWVTPTFEAIQSRIDKKATGSRYINSDYNQDYIALKNALADIDMIEAQVILYSDEVQKAGMLKKRVKDALAQEDYRLIVELIEQADVL